MRAAPLMRRQRLARPCRNGLTANARLTLWLPCSRLTRCEVAELRRRDWSSRRARPRGRRNASSRPEKPRVARSASLQRRRDESNDCETQRNERVKALARSLPKTLYRSVDEADLEREAHALALLRERFAEWQTLGYIPSRAITPGAKTNEPVRTRGWTHWHHLFTPRQLLAWVADARDCSTTLSTTFSR